MRAEGSFPAATWPHPALAPEQRLSWLSRLLAAEGWQPPTAIAWDRAWNDPLNEFFVRRRIAEFQNPAIEKLTGSDGFPATHFVGVTGVGPAAASLPLDDPRAGVFGNDRRTRAVDIVDGLSQTLLVAGVRDQLGSWAAGGMATARGFQREPYVNGPDGFGTGQLTGMTVLMADGSVREIAAGTDPAIVRQLATIADQRTLPRAPGAQPVAGDPPRERETVARETTEKQVPVPPPPAARGTGPAPPQDATPPVRGGGEKAPGVQRIEAEPVAPVAGKVPAKGRQRPVKNINPQAALDIRLQRYQREEAVPLSTVLDELAEFTGLDIVFDPSVIGPDAAQRLETKVRPRLEGTTVRGVLTSVLAQADLKFEIREGRLHLLSATPAP